MNRCASSIGGDEAWVCAVSRPPRAARMRPWKPLKSVAAVIAKKDFRIPNRAEETRELKYEH
jgi:hypothetical protein